MTEKEKIKDLVLRYAQAIHTQDQEDFCSLWADNSDCILISITSKFQGIEELYRNFLLDGIGAAYQRIDLLIDSLEVHILREDLATVVLSYHTECIRRENGEPYGISGLETQVVVKAGDQWKLQHIHYSKR